MGIKFCKNCKSLLYKKEDSWYCKVCSISFNDVSLESSEVMSGKREVAIINEKDNETLPIIYNKCTKCGNEYAYFWHTHGIGDEADTIFYRCTKCNIVQQKGGQRGGR